MATFKLIKKKDFTVGTDKHVHYTTAYAGRIIAVSTLNIEADKIKEDKDKLVVSGEFDLVNRPWADPITGEMKSGLVLLPKLDIAISAY